VAAVVAFAIAEAIVVAGVDVDEGNLAGLATAIGEAWAGELVHGFRLGKRKIVGPWPGTIGEARVRVLTGLRRRLERQTLDDLARVASAAARREWNHFSQPDPEP
jgi:hypothetical protein